MVRTIQHTEPCSYSTLSSADNIEGDLTRIGPNWLMTSDPEIIRYMSAAKYKHQKSSWYASLKVDPYVHSVFSETSLEKHDKLRVKMQSGVCTALHTTLSI
jgi:hypothetical protein